MALTLVDPAAREPITIDEAKDQLRVTHERLNAYIDTVLIPGVRDRAELSTQRQLITATWRETLDAWPCEGYIEVPRPPLQSVTSITYVDTAGVTQTLSPSLYNVSAPTGPRAPRGRISLAYGQAWPTVRQQANAITITFVAGYGDDPTDVPPLLRKAMLEDLATAYANPEGHVTGTIVAAIPGHSLSVYRGFKCRVTQRRAA